MTIRNNVADSEYTGAACQTFVPSPSVTVPAHQGETPGAGSTRSGAFLWVRVDLDRHCAALLWKAACVAQVICWFWALVNASRDRAWFEYTMALASGHGGGC